jgi:hypothetical protein
MKKDMNRRTFLGSATVSMAALNIVPRQVLAGSDQVAPSDRITFANVGCGTQGIREMLGMLAMPEVQIVAVCDPVKDGNEYVDWSKDGHRAAIADALGKPDWRRGRPGIPGGRDVAEEIVETYYKDRRSADHFKGCASYSDFRQLLDREKDLDAVKVMTPDHLHAAVAIAAMKKGKRVMVHKPLANRVQEARVVIETARQTKVPTHFLPASPGEQVRMVAGWINDGAIGTLREIHNWSNRPVWPQYATIPADQPPIPKDFDWELWLGPSLPRPYHPHYTHAVFRGWYEFGGGAIADMGHYSLWPVFREFDLDAPIVVESTPSHVCTVTDQVSITIHNDYSFPVASTIRFKFAAKENRPAIDLIWYDGGIRPPTPEELLKGNEELQAEGMMFVGDQGKILADFRGDRPRIISGRKSQDPGAAPAAQAPRESRRDRGRSSAWIQAFKGGPPTCGDFLLAGPISEAFNLGAVSLRLGGKRLLWDAQNMRVTNLPEANKYLVREYRKGWELNG